MELACPSSGTGEGESDYQGVDVPWPLALAQTWTSGRDTNTQKITGSGAAHREGGGKKGRWRDTQWAHPQVLTGTWVQAEGGKGGGNRRGKRRQTQTRGAGRRDKQQRLEGGRCVKFPGGRSYAPGKEVECGCERVVLQQRTATDGEGRQDGGGNQYRSING